MKRIKVGLIGGGFIGRVHTEALRRLGFIDVIAIAEADQKLAEERAEELLIPVRKKSLKEVETFTVQKLKPEDYEDVKIDTEDLGIVLLKIHSRMFSATCITGSGKEKEWMRKRRISPPL